MTTAIAPRLTREMLEDRMAGLWDEPTGTGSASELWGTLYGAVCDLIEGVARIPSIGSVDDDLPAQELAGHVMNLVHEAIIDGVDHRGIAS